MPVICEHDTVWLDCEDCLTTDLDLAQAIEDFGRELVHIRQDWFGSRY
jgi:hypothetical protein